MSEQQAEEPSPITHAQMQVLFEQHRDHIDNALDEYKTHVDDHIKEMGFGIVAGFDKVSKVFVDEMSEWRKQIFPSAMGEKRLDASVVMPIIYTLCGVIAALIVWFTGVRPFIPGYGSGVTTQPTMESHAQVSPRSN